MKQFAIKLLKAIAITISIFAVAIIVSYAMRIHEWVGWTLYGVAFILCVFFVISSGKGGKRYYFVSCYANDAMHAFYINIDGYFVAKKIADGISNSVFNGEFDVSIVSYKEITKEEFKAQEGGGNNACTNRK